MALEFGRDGTIEGLAIGMITVGDDGRGNAGRGGDSEARRLRFVAHHASDLGGVVRSLRCFDQRGEVAAAAGDQNADLQPGHRLSAWSTTQSASSVGAFSMTPISLT